MTDKINFPKITIEKEIPNETLEQIRQIAPNVLEDGKVNCKKLNEAIGEMLVDPDEPEHFGLNWPGKRQSIKLARTPSKQTLIPVPGDGVDEDKTQNLFIEGENMEVLKLLQKSYSGRIKMIYIDPPYNTGSDLIYKDKFTETEKNFLESTGQIDEEGNDMVANKKSSGRFHTNWLNMIYPRLKLAKELLTDDGLMFFSIGEEELSDTVAVLNEIFGDENKISIISRMMKSGGNKGYFFSPNIDYIVVYAKNLTIIDAFRGELSEELIEKVYTKIETEGLKKGERYRLMGLYQAGLQIRANQRYWIECPDGSFVIPNGKNFPAEIKNGSKIKPSGGDGVWRWIYERFADELKKDNIVFLNTETSSLIDEKGNRSKWNIYTKIWLKDRLEDGRVPTNLITDMENRRSSAELKELNIPFDFAKPSALISYLATICRTEDSDLILDFFAGSGTTGHAVMQLNSKIKNGHRKFICVQMPEVTKEGSEAFKAGYKNIAELCKERLRRTGKKIKEETKAEIDYGFKVFKLQKESNLKDESEMFGMTDQLTLESAEENLSSLRKDWTKEKLLTEILLIEGFPLTSKIEKSSITTNEILIVTSSFEDRPDKLVICLDSEINRATIDNLPVGELDNFIFLESSLPKVGGDEIKQILHERFKSRIKVI